MPRYYDVTLPITDNAIVYPGDREVSFKRTFTIEKNGYNWSELSCGTHLGTHMDSPFHFVADGRTLDDLPYELMISDVEVVETDADMISAAVLKDVKIDDWRSVFFKTKNQELWRREKTEGFIFDYVSLDASAADYLVEKGTRLVGIDYRSIEGFNLPDYSVHKILLGNGTFIVEGLYLNDVPAGRYNLYCLPLKLAAADGGPVRVILSI